MHGQPYDIGVSSYKLDRDRLCTRSVEVKHQEVALLELLIFRKACVIGHILEGACYAVLTDLNVFLKVFY